MSPRIQLKPGQFSLNDLRNLWQAPHQLVLDPEAWPAMQASADVVARIFGKGHAAYGINTGFGKLAHTRIPDEQLEELQRNLILSHSVGVGEALSPAVTRLVMALKIGSLARGFSGVRPVIVETLLAALNAGVIPHIPAKGSVGASGDLAPLSHMTLALMGEGDAWLDGQRLPAREVLAKTGITPLRLAAKEGLALINGTQVSTALTLHGLFMAERVFAAATLSGALAIDAARGSDAPFDARIHEVRGQAGQIRLARIYRELLVGSEIRKSHLENDERVQDPYSLRCQPQVMGACHDLITQAARTLLIEANAVTDNPLVFAGENGADDAVLSGGNFHAEPVAFAADTLALAISEIGALSERRIALLIDASLSGLPPFLVNAPGLNSGFMIAHVTAAALASENKTLAHPASIDSLPTSANQEDHVSMATFAGRRLDDIARNTATVVGIELLAAAQGVDFHAPLVTSPRLAQVRGHLRAKVPFYEKDRWFSPDIENATTLVLAGNLGANNEDLLDSLFE